MGLFHAVQEPVASIPVIAENVDESYLKDNPDFRPATTEEYEKYVMYWNLFYDYNEDMADYFADEQAYNDTLERLEAMKTLKIARPFNTVTGKNGNLSAAEKRSIRVSAAQAISAGYTFENNTVYPAIVGDEYGTEIEIHFCDYDRTNAYNTMYGLRHHETGNLLDPWDHVQRHK